MSMTRRLFLGGLAAMPFVGWLFKPERFTEAEILEQSHRAGYTGFNFIETSPMDDEIIRAFFKKPYAPPKPLTVADIKMVKKLLDMD